MVLSRDGAPASVQMDEFFDFGIDIADEMELILGVIVHL